MRWAHIKLIFAREVRDQLRDRRTMFTVLFLPLLLYPLMGSIMFEIAQFQRESRATIGVVGDENIPRELPLSQMSNDVGLEWKPLPRTDRISECIKSLQSESLAEWETKRVDFEKCLRESGVDSMVYVPSDFATKTWTCPLYVISNLSGERSTIAASLFDRVVTEEHSKWVRDQLSQSSLGATILDPPSIRTFDVAPPHQKGVFLWSKILPFVVLIWALTGAFYPAVDLCAGEKERGTLETLLCSPARRQEIVWGKLMTVMCFSMGTALLNMTSMYLTASFVMGRIASSGCSEMAAALGPLPIQSIGWLILLVIPISVMFSALALAVASLARSTKEGQYYLMPLMLVGMPLVSLPMLPGVSLSPGTSIIPVTGAVLLSRALMDGEYMTAILHFPTVATITILCSLLAVRWAVRQFESESAMLKDSARYSVKNWLRDAWRQRENTPTVNESVICGMLILSCLFFGRLTLSSVELSWSSIVANTLTIQLGMILGPVLIMATILTRSVPKSLRVHRITLTQLATVCLFAVSLHPSYTMLASAVSNEYKLGAETTQLLMQFDTILAAAPIGAVLVVMALLPAISEELVFRGFLFAGLERDGGKLRAILLTSILFGLSHGVLQQSVTACIMGLLLGWLAVRSGSVLTTIAFHFVHNSVSMLFATFSSRGNRVPEWLSWAVTMDEGRWAYTDTWSTTSVGVAIGLLALIVAQSRPRPIDSPKSNELAIPRSLTGVPIARSMKPIQQ